MGFGLDLLVVGLRFGYLDEFCVFGCLGMIVVLCVLLAYCVF